MTDAQRTELNRHRLGECHPAFRSALATALAQLQAQGFRPRIQCAWRSPADQLEAFKSGHSHLRFSFHNVTSALGQPEALAADVLDDDHPLSPSREYLLALVRLAHANGLDTGIAWDLPPNIRTALVAAVVTGEPWTGKLGFDPCHVEITGLSIAEAKNGKRPGDPPTMNV